MNNTVIHPLWKARYARKTSREVFDKLQYATHVRLMCRYANLRKT